MKTIKTIIVLLAAALLAWALPWCYAFVCSEPQESPLTLYSCVTHDFATFSFEGHDDAAGYDPAGNPYTERQFDSIMPTVFTRRLAEEGRLPERIDGIPFDAREVELSNFVFRASPSELNRPQIGLYLSESTQRNYTAPNLATDGTGRANTIVKQEDMPVETKFDYGIAAGLGTEWSHPRLGHFQLEARYYYGLGNIYGSSKSDFFGKSNFGNIVVKASYLFDIIKK